MGVRTPGTEVAERVDRDPRAALSGAGHRSSTPTPHDDDGAAGRARRRPARAPADRLQPVASTGPYAELVGQDRVVPYLFPTPAMTPRPAGADADRGARPGRRFCYDTMTLVGPGTWEAARARRRLRPDRGGPASPRARASRTPCAARRATTRPAGGYGGSCYLNNAAVAARGAARPRARPRRGRRHRRPPRQRHPGDLLRRAATCCTASVHVDPGAGWFPHHRRLRRRDRTRRRPRRQPERPARPGTGDADWLDGGAALRDRRSRARGRRARRLARGRRGRRRSREPAAGHPGRLPPRPGACSAGLGAADGRRCRRAATTSTTLGPLVAATLAGLGGSG